AVEQFAETKLAADRLSLLHVLLSRRPSPAHQQIERETFAHHVIFVSLRSRSNSSGPTIDSPGVQIESSQKNQAGVRPAHAGEKRNQRRLSGAGNPFDQNLVAGFDFQLRAIDRSGAAFSVTKNDAPSFDQPFMNSFGLLGVL